MTLYDNCIAFFVANGIFKDLNADPDKAIIHTLFTEHNLNIDFQEARTGYDYITTRKDSTDQIHYSWADHMPVTKEGNWITIWRGAGAGYTIQIPFGMVLLLHSNVAHGGGMPKKMTILSRNHFVTSSSS